MSRSNRIRPKSIIDGPWFFAAEPVFLLRDFSGYIIWAIPAGLTAKGRLPLILLTNTNPDGSYAIHRNGPTVEDYRKEFMDYVDAWLVGIGLPPGDHRFDIWMYWHFGGRQKGQTEREFLKQFYDRVAKRGVPPPGPKWSTSDSDAKH